jgi:hypothetical protein
MNWFYFVLATLATYRIAHMIAREDGPFDMFMLLREFAGQEKWYGRGLHCVLCISFWLSLPAALLVGLPWLMGWLGIAGGVLVLHLIFNGGK